MPAKELCSNISGVIAGVFALARSADGGDAEVRKLGHAEGGGLFKILTDVKLGEYY
jgi:hypothetical protein